MNMNFKRKLPIPKEIKNLYPLNDDLRKIKEEREGRSVDSKGYFDRQGTKHHGKPCRKDGTDSFKGSFQSKLSVCHDMGNPAL